MGLGISGGNCHQYCDCGSKPDLVQKEEVAVNSEREEQYEASLFYCLLHRGKRFLLEGDSFFLKPHSEKNN